LAEFKRGEWAFLDWIRKGWKDLDGRIPLGPGDDCAIIASGAKKYLVTTDMLCDGTHFVLAEHGPSLVGRKAVAASLSDIAAMGGEPLAAFVCVAFPRRAPMKLGRELYRAMDRVARRYGCAIAGGDVVSHDAGLVVSVCMVGTAPRRAVVRSGAKPGDLVFVTGELGGSILGRHARFAPRLAEGRWLAEKIAPNAMIDLSDGLATDIGHIADDSGVAVEIHASSVPVSRAARKSAAADGRSGLDHALCDGEDFELAFTVSARKAKRMVAAWPFRTKLTCVGRVREGKDTWIVDLEGGTRRLERTGYEHLR